MAHYSCIVMDLTADLLGQMENRREKTVLAILFRWQWGLISSQAALRDLFCPGLDFITDEFRTRANLHGCDNRHITELLARVTQCLVERMPGHRREERLAVVRWSARATLQV